MNEINCRAQVSTQCFHGRPIVAQFGFEGTMEDDGTYDIATNSIVCDACYIKLMPFTPSGRALRDEVRGSNLKEAIRLAKS
jgi:hypothetical protein